MPTFVLLSMWKKTTPHAILAGIKRYGQWSLGLLMLFVVLACTGCPPSLAGDWELKLRGVASSSGFVGYELDGELFTVDVETGETAEQIGQRLTALMKAEGLTVECELYDGERYYFILRDIDGPPESQSHALGIGGGSCGPLQDDRMLIELQVKGFYAILNANKRTGLRDYTTVEYRQDALDVMASMADSGEQIVLESVENMTVDCYQATVCLHLIRVVGTEQQPVDTCLTLTQPSPCEEWLVSGGVIR